MLKYFIFFVILFLSLNLVAQDKPYRYTISDLQELGYVEASSEGYGNKSLFIFLDEFKFYCKSATNPDCIDYFSKLVNKLPNQLYFDQVLFYYIAHDDFSEKCLNTFSQLVLVKGIKIGKLELIFRASSATIEPIATTHLSLDALAQLNASTIFINEINEYGEDAFLSLDQKSDSLKFNELHIENYQKKIILDNKIFNNTYRMLTIISPITIKQFETVVRRCKGIQCTLADSSLGKQYVIDLNNSVTEKIWIDLINFKKENIEVRSMNLVNCCISISMYSPIKNVKYILGADSIQSVFFLENSVFYDLPQDTILRKIEIEYLPNVKYVHELKLPRTEIININRSISYGNFMDIKHKYLPLDHLKSIKKIEVRNIIDFRILKAAMTKNLIPKETTVIINLNYEQPDTLNLIYIYNFMNLLKQYKTIIQYYCKQIPIDTAREDHGYSEQYYKDIIPPLTIALSHI